MLNQTSESRPFVVARAVVRAVVEKRYGGFFSQCRRLFSGAKLKSADSNCLRLSSAQEVDLSESPDFSRKRQLLEGLVCEFGHDPAKVTLSQSKRTFDCLGQSFTAEGEALPDGRVEIFYDPEMSDARMGCCLSHELQHIRYFAVRSAYHAEPPEGRLHLKFAKYTPELLAAERGVSDYSNEHWDAWKGGSPPELFSMELEQGRSEPINETISEVAKALYNWGPDVRINPIWKELQQAINEEYEKLDTPHQPSG